MIDQSLSLLTKTMPVIDNLFKEKLMANRVVIRYNVIYYVYCLGINNE